MKFSMKIMTALAIFAMCCSGAFVMANDSDNSDATTDYAVVDGCLTISGGSTIDYSDTVNLGTLYTFTTCVIGSDVEYLGTYAFYGCSNLTSVTFSDSLLYIGTSAFEGCTGLTSLTLPSSASTIYEDSFSGCTGLISITIPDTYTELWDGIFTDCTGLTSIIIPDLVTTIGNCVFEGCTGLTSIIIPDSVTSIGGYAFDGCTNLINMYCVGASGSISFYNDTSVPEDCIISYDYVEPAYYTVSFDVGISDVTSPASQTIESGSCAIIPALAVEGYTVAWYSDPTLTAEYDFASSITADTTLYLGLTAVVVPVDPDPQTDEGLTSDVDSMLIAGLILLIIGIITLVCMFAIGFPPINPIVIIVDLAVIAAGAILIFFGV